MKLYRVKGDPATIVKEDGNYMTVVYSPNDVYATGHWVCDRSAALPVPLTIQENILIRGKIMERKLIKKKKALT